MSSLAMARGDHSDSKYHQWFETQHSIGGAWCCNVADGHLLNDDEWRADGSKYEVKIEGKWYPISPDALRDPKGGPNPTGQAIVWYLPSPKVGFYIYCFAPGFQF